MNTCWAPHHEMSPKRFTMATVVLFSASSLCPVNMPNPIRIRSGYRPARKRWPEAGPMVLAHRLSSGTDPFGHSLTKPSRTKLYPGLFCTIWSRPSLEERTRIRCGRKSGPAYNIIYDPARFRLPRLAVMATTDRNQNASGSDPVCLLDSVYATLKRV